MNTRIASQPQAAGIWFPGWYDRHKALNPHNGWPTYEREGGLVQRTNWLQSLVLLEATEADANQASTVLSRRGEIWPHEQLAKLVELLRPIVASRRIDEEAFRRRCFDHLADAAYRARADARKAFDRLDESTRELHYNSIRLAFPAIAAIPGMVRYFAVECYRGEELPDPRTMKLPPAPVHVSRSAPTPIETPLSPGQVQFLDALTPMQRSAFEAMSPAKQREILVPHELAYNPAFVAILASELATHPEAIEAA